MWSGSEEQKKLQWNLPESQQCESGGQHSPAAFFFLQPAYKQALLAFWGVVQKKVWHPFLPQQHPLNLLCVHEYGHPCLNKTPNTSKCFSKESSGWHKPVCVEQWMHYGLSQNQRLQETDFGMKPSPEVFWRLPSSGGCHHRESGQEEGWLSHSTVYSKFS